jgi:hypothetical protein
MSTYRYWCTDVGTQTSVYRWWYTGVNIQTLVNRCQHTDVGEQMSTYRHWCTDGGAQTLVHRHLTCSMSRLHTHSITNTIVHLIPASTHTYADDRERYGNWNYTRYVNTSDNTYSGWPRAIDDGNTDQIQVTGYQQWAWSVWGWAVESAVGLKCVRLNCRMCDKTCVLHFTNVQQTYVGMYLYR